MKYQRHSFLFLIFILLLNVQYVFGQETNTLDEVTLRESWFPYIDYSVNDVGIKKGFFKDEGITLSIKAAKGSTLAAQVIASGEDQFGIIATDTTLMSALKGMPLIVLAVLHQNTPTSVFSLKKSNIKNPKDLEGRTLASDPASMKHNEFKTFCKINNVDIEKIKILPVKGTNFKYLLSGDADAMLAFNYMGDAELRCKGYDVNEFHLAKYGLNSMGKGIVVRKDFLDKNKDLAKRFMRAIIKSWQYAIDNPEEAVDILMKYHPELDKETLLNEIDTFLGLLHNEYTDKYGLGHQDKKKWEEMGSLLFEQGIISQKPKIKEIYTNKYLP